jgi:hypothetical protein
MQKPTSKSLLGEVNRTFSIPRKSTKLIPQDPTEIFTL